MVKIFYNRAGFLDFEAPIFMIEDQRKKFVEGIKIIFGQNVTVEEIVENKKEIEGIKRHPKAFSLNDLVNLANSGLSNEELAEKFHKTDFAIQMKRGPFIMELQEWGRKKGKTKFSAKDIEDFIGEKE